MSIGWKLERVKGIEPLTACLEGRCSTSELHPLIGAPGTGSNLRPSPYKDAALPLSYKG